MDVTKIHSDTLRKNVVICVHLPFVSFGHFTRKISIFLLQCLSITHDTSKALETKAKNFLCMIEIIFLTFQSGLYYQNILSISFNGKLEIIYILHNTEVFMLLLIRDPEIFTYFLSHYSINC